MFDVVYYREGGVSCEYEVAVHAVDGEVAGDSELGGGKGLRDNGAAINTAGAWGVVEGSGVGIEVRADGR